MFKKSILLISLFVISAFAVSAQSPTQLRKKCPNASTYADVSITALGNITVDPCSGRSTTFTGTVNLPSGGATSGGLTGNPNLAFNATQITSTTTSSQLFRSLNYNFSNNAGTAEFQMALQPSNSTGSFSVGDCTTTPTSCLTIAQGSATASLMASNVTIGDNNNIGIFSTQGAISQLLSRTVTPAGTTGAQTINKQAGTVNVAAGAASIVVTNSTVTTTSIPFVVLRTADGTCTFVKSAVSTANTLTITLNANCTAETSVGFIIYN